MDKAIPYILVALLVTGLVLFETWWGYRKLDPYAPEREDYVVRGVANSIVYGTFWPTTLILYVLGKVMRK